MRIAVLLALLLALLTACSTKPPIPPPSTDIDETLFRDAVRVLASDEFAGRRPGTAGGDRSVAFLTDRFRKLGLKPGNGTGKTASFLQTVPLVEITPGAGASLSVSGQTGTHALKLGQDAVIWTKRAVPEVHVRRSDLLFVGYGTVAPEYSWNDYEGIDAHGKTVIVLAGDPGVGGKDPTVFKGNSLTAYGRWEYKLEEAARQGADAVLLVYDPAAAGFDWDTVVGTWGAAQFELAAPDGYAARTAIEGWIRLDAARRVFEDAGLDFARTAAAAGHAGFKALPIHSKMDGALSNSLRTFDSQNVVAVLPGDKHRDEYVLYTAHWDSLGVDRGHGAQAIYRGAVDNATGTAGLLALAQSFARTKPPPERSIVFLATTAGDPELLGSTYYAENPLFPLRRTAAVIDVDSLLPGGHARDLAIFGFGNTDLEETARAVALLQGRETHGDPFPELGLYYGSDSYTFAHHGVPVLFAQSGIDNAARGPAYGKAQREDFLAHRDREPSDQYADDWNVVGAIDDLTLYYEVGIRVARGRRFPRWTPNSEFRGSRHRAGEAEPHAE
jgi:Zn-dependent M28 family amino/carboxypeptidase